MKKRNKIIVAVLAIAVAGVLIPVGSALASGNIASKLFLKNQNKKTVEASVKTDAPTLQNEVKNNQSDVASDSEMTVENVTGKAGETVEVSIMLHKNPGIAGATIELKYDPQLTLTDVSNGDALETLTFTKPDNLQNPCKFLWDSEKGMSQKDGVLLKLGFAISKQAVSGAELPVRISYTDGDIFDENLKNVKLKTVDGKVSIVEDYDCDKDGHKYSVLNKVDATCTEPEKTTYKCEVCGKTYVKETAKASGHTYQAVTVKATLTKNGMVKKVCSKCGDVLSSKTIFAPKTVSLSSMVYTGKKLIPKVVVKDSKGKVVSKSNYSVIAKNNLKVGKGKVTISFKGIYTGSISKTFDILPKATSITKVSAKAKGFCVNWKKQTAQTSGYQIQYATNSGFSKAVSKKLNGNKTTKYTGKGLKSRTKYYVRVRTYQKVSGKTYYSKWSAAKSVVTKK